MDTIYEPREDSQLLRKYVKKLAFGRVLDLGTGSGFQLAVLKKKKEVKEILATDIEEEAIKNLQNKFKKKIKNKKIKFLLSDLFSQIKGKFDTIIFNPPYLPLDKNITDKTIYGGKKGSEILEKFLDSLAPHLKNKGFALIIFSSLTSKERIIKRIENNLLTFKELEKKHFFFEDLFVYKIGKSSLLQELEKKGIRQLKYLSKGKRGLVFKGVYQGKKVAIKIKRKESQAQGRIQNEIKYLKILNKKKIGPRLLFYGQNYLVMDFLEGDSLLNFLEKNKQNKPKIKKILSAILKQCFELDKLNINKEEMHRPFKHIFINKKEKPILIDFERAYLSSKPHNLTQFIVFLKRKGLIKKKENLREVLSAYKKERKEKQFKKILKLIFT